MAAVGALSLTALASLPGPAAAEQVLVATDAARVALEPIATATSLGSRARLAADFAAFETSLTAAVEHGGGRLNSADVAWAAVVRPASWTSEDVQLQANWSPWSDIKLSLETGDRERRTRNFADPRVDSAIDQLAVDQARYLHLRLAVQADDFSVQAGAETSLSALDLLNAGGPVGGDTRRHVASRRIFAHVAWRPTQAISLQAGETAQMFDVGWRGAGAVSSETEYLTPHLALVVTPSARVRWQADVEETVLPVDPSQFAAYAQLAAPGGGSAPQPEHGFRYGLSLKYQLPSGTKLTAGATGWRLRSVTDLGPVGAGEAPISIGQGARRQIELNVAAPLARLGLPSATLAGAVSWRNSQVRDPFTGLPRPISGEAPYRAQLRISGALPALDLSWSLVAKADGPQSLHQMAKVTTLSSTTGLGGILSYERASATRARARQSAWWRA